ncbi:hypothetical protein QBC32DRAFT_332548 [Pseudoneurospora amorphoporcata]|uniref:Secreted protein n=1 Tax=Pseudoneurospora amorphoporcata TaxID=241081 RepID=A0AAN6P1Q7_9PEZI|nr:hypothetical protein QBC32DRAFT_332548 [Pseudoneurospora amorphoporcata]
MFYCPPRLHLLSPLLAQLPLSSGEPNLPPHHSCLYGRTKPTTTASCARPDTWHTSRTSDDNTRPCRVPSSGQD